MIYNRDKNTQITKNFMSNEFACADGTRQIIVDLDLVDELQQMRDFIKKPIRISSGYRTEAYNKKCGGIEDSEHTKGKATDIQIDGVTPEEVFYLARYFTSTVL
jgi:uncharacterized protein YcbK (DUF882 family)